MMAGSDSSPRLNGACRRRSPIPEFGYKVSYRRLLELQARLMARHLLGELDDNPNFTTR